MTLKDLQSNPLSNILEQMEMVDLKIHSDDKGIINSIEIKYAAHKEPNTKGKEPTWRQ